MYHLLVLVLPTLSWLVNCHQLMNSVLDTTQNRFTIQFQSSIEDTSYNNHDRFLNYLESQDMLHQMRVRYNYSTIINGMSIELIQPDLTASSIKKDINWESTLSNCPYILRYWSGKTYQRPKTMKEIPLLYTDQGDQSLLDYFGNNSVAPLVVDGGRANLGDAHILTTADRVHKEGWTGQGIKVGIIDTGIDYTHPALGGCFGVTYDDMWFELNKTLTFPM